MTSVPATTHDRRAPADLKPGDWLHADFITDHGDGGEIVEFVAAHRRRDGEFLLVFRWPGGDVDADRVSGCPIPVADATAAAEAVQRAHREAVAAQLYSLAQLITDARLPVGVSVQVDLHVDRADLDAVAEHLGVAVDASSPLFPQVVWPVDQHLYDPGVHARWHAAPAYQPEPELVGAREVDNGDNPAVIPDGVDGLPVGQQPARRYRPGP